MRADLDDALRVEMDRHQRDRQRKADDAAFHAYLRATYEEAEREGRVLTICGDTCWRQWRGQRACLWLALYGAVMMGAAAAFGLLLAQYGG